MSMSGTEKISSQNALHEHYEATALCNNSLHCTYLHNTTLQCTALQLIQVNIHWEGLPGKITILDPLALLAVMQEL